MTYEQTLERIEKQKKAVDSYPPKFIFVGITEDYQNVRQALEKQIQKEVIHEQCECCPGCGVRLENFRRYDSYCGYCGQRLEWVREDE